jgi:amino acid adenylation domain-containing protein
MNLPPEQESIRAKCFHPSGKFVEFPTEDVETSIPERFEKIVRAYPGHLAIKTPGDELTYDELNSIANRVAHALLDYARSDAQPVALLFEKGVQIVVAMLGVLKAGHFFVLLDPALPREKMAAVLAKSQATLVLSDAGNLQLARDLAGAGAKVVDYESLSLCGITTNCKLSLTPQMLGCVVYTSGSTGEPKGVIWSHQTFLHNTMVLTNIYHTCKDDKISLMTSMSPGALETIADALLNGATLYVYDFQRSGISELGDWLIREQISFCSTPSPLFRHLAESVKAHHYFSDLRLVKLRSDKVHESDIELCKKIFPPACIIATGLAMTETGTLRTILLDQDTKILGDEVPIGFPVEDKKIFLIDDDGKEVGFNEVGEIVVRSKYLSPGYWNNPELTKTKFKLDSEDPDMRIYYTGDLGLMLPDGCLIHKGRKDFRVKIQGYGVDLVEVERALLSHAGIREAVAVSLRKRSGDTRLIAYFVSARELSPTVSDLRSYLGKKLADYMIPSAFVRLDKIPLTTNGKVDRGALPEPDDKRPELSTPYAGPRNETEYRLVQIWQEVLDVHPIGINDVFFDLGGNSLIAARLFVEIEKVFGKQFPLTTLYWAGTVEKLAAILQQTGWSAPWSLLFPIQPGGSKPPFFWVYGETTDVLLPCYLGADQPLYGLMNEARTGKRVRYTKLNDIAANHLKDIQMVQPRGPYFLGGFCFGGMVAFEMAQQLLKEGQEVALLFLVDLGTLSNWKSRFEKTESVRHRVSRHSRDLRAINFQEKLNYIYVRVKATVKKATMSEFRSSRNQIAETVTRNAYFVSGRPLPPLLRQRYLTSVDEWAMQHYEPEVYPNDLILFKARGSSYDPRIIAKLTGGKFHFHELPCLHSEMLKEPQVSVWANQLKSYLHMAQATQRRAHPPVSPIKDNEESLLKQAIATRQA